MISNGVKEIRILIYGDVHGVGFRYHTQEMAQPLGLSGYVKNLPDGSLEIVAQGKKENLEKLITWAGTGPRFAKVERIETEWRNPSEPLKTFEIKY